MEIYKYKNEDIAASPEDIFRFVNDDKALKRIFSILKDVEYHTKGRRGKGSKFRITLGVRNKTYRFRNEIVEAVKDRSITMKTKLKQGVITTVFNVTPVGEHSKLTVQSSIESGMGVRVFVMTTKPLVKVIMNKEMNKFIEEVEEYSAS